MYKLATLIPTINRPTLRRSIKSIANQTRTPDEVIIISDKKIDQYHFDNIQLTYIINSRTKNLSGAVNTGLEYLLKHGWNPEQTYISILDDDDEWEPTYLQKCYERAVANNLDLVITGLIRLTSQESIELDIPNEIDPDIFLIKNPHIQSSNLFVKFSKLLKAGCYDERLQSTTDRDICYRIFDLDIKYQTINEHLVNHWAIKNQNRLSDPSSPQKKSGLEAFYQKYSPIMTKNQKDLFKERAKKIFNINIEANERSLIKNETPDKNATKYFPIVIGFISSNIDTTEQLVKDIKELFQNYPNKYQVVICDNSNDSTKLEQLFEKHLESYIFYNKIKINQDCDKGLFGSHLIPLENREGIASGRTILHRYIYDEMKKNPSSVAWILDDDIRLESLQIDGTSRKITLHELNHTIIQLKTQGIPIANGKITGEPPLPFLSTIRTQLLDLHYNLKKIKNKSTFKDEQTRIISENRDYYYDLSGTNYTHLETPIYLNEIQSIDDIESWIKQLIGGSNLSRPVIDYPNKTIEKIPPRGGNTLIINPKCIRDYPNISPRIGNTSFRRGDRFWCILNYYHGGRIITESPITVKHTRTLKREDAFSFSRLLSDFYGSSFVKAMEDYYTTKNDELGWTPRRIQLSLSEESIETIISLFNKHLLDRVTNFTMNAYRINGLLKNIRKQLNNITDLSYSIHKELDFIESTFSSDNISMFENISLAINYEELKQFLRLLKQYVKTYRDNISTKITNREIVHSKVTLTNLGLLTRKDDVKLLGYGDEGTVFTDGKKVFKHFFYGKSGFPENIYDFVFKKMLNKNTLSHFSKLTEIVDKDGELVFVFPFEDSTNYNGGQIDDIQDFLLESKSNGIVVTNVHPKNFVLVDGVLKHVDIGSSIIPYSEKEYLQMCKRAYLTYRWHFRKDLSKLMAIPLFNEDIPELFGYQYFLESLKIKTKEETLDPTIINIVTRTGPCSVLDYGCGKGKISEELATLGCSVVSYDINYQQIEKNIAKHTQVKYLTLENLSAQYGKFDKVLCSLVLCTIESDKEVTHIVRDLRKYVEDSGEAIVVICNPFNTFVRETETHIKQNIPDTTSYYKKFSYSKLVKETSNIRKEVHRPFSYYEHLFNKEGFKISKITEISSTDVNEIAPASDFMILQLKPITVPYDNDVSLLIKVSAMEWKSIDFQIKHIINQLEGPQRFREKIVVTDKYNGPYLRQYTDPNYSALMEKLDKLKKEGIIDRVVVVNESPEDVKTTMKKWFELNTSQSRCSNGQPIYTIIMGFEEIRSKYILHVDSDCIFVRRDRCHDYLGDMIKVLESDIDAISVSFNIAHDEDIEYSYDNNGEPWRIETRCSLIHKPRLIEQLPLPNKLDNNGNTQYPWHRSLDQAIKQQKLHSYRGADPRTFYVHTPNRFKTNLNAWYNVVKAAERGDVPSSQIGKVDLQNMCDWLGPVDGEFVILVRGVDVSLPKLRRCLESVQSQNYCNWNVIFIDAGSINPMQEYLEKIASIQFSGKCTYWFNREQLTSMENIYVASKRLCSNPESILVHLDADDALINNMVLDTLKYHYDSGADLTVGSMLRTDKDKKYPVCFKARKSRGGNVWQHLRSYKKHLFDKIPPEYFKVQDNWVAIAEDWAFMIPLTDIAQNPVHITELLYFYQPNELKSNKKLKLREEVIKEIISKPEFEII